MFNTCAVSKKGLGDVSLWRGCWENISGINYPNEHFLHGPKFPRYLEQKKHVAQICVTLEVLGR